MKLKTLLLAFALVSSLVATAAEANLTVVSGQNHTKSCCTSPLSINLVTPIGLPWGNCWDVCGLQTGLYNGVNDFTGLQIGVLNVTEYFCGLQLGVVNVTRKMQGVQLGLVNVIQDNDVPFLPILNFYF